MGAKAGHARGFDGSDAALVERRPMARSQAVRYALVSPIQLLPLLVVAVLWFCYQREYVSNDVPFWVLAAALVAAQVVATVSFIVFPARCSMPQLAVRTALTTAAVGIALYATGWGPVLAVGFGFVAAEAVRTDGSRAARLATIFSTVAVIAGQACVEFEILPSFLPPNRVHGIALLSFLGTVVIIELVRLTALEKESAVESMRVSEARFRALVQHATDVILVIQPDWSIEYASPSTERTLGYPPASMSFGKVIHPDDLARTEQFIEYLVSEPDEVSSLEVRLRHADGSWRWFDVGASNRLADPAVSGIVCNMRDVTERVRFEDELSRQAYHDPVTGLPNRASFLERLEEALDVVRRYQGELAVLFLDLDRFKIVNDTLGHDVGDRLLAAIAERITETVRPDDLVARFGGDEFTILRPLVATPEEAPALAGELLDALGAPIRVDAHELVVQASVGVTTSRGEDEAGDLLRQSDLAMYVAKENGRARWETFDGQSAEPYVERLAVEHDLRRALNRSELVVYYQPEVTLDSGLVTTCESLLRWQHPTRGLLSPASFIPYAEETTLILDIDRYLLRQACLQCQQWDVNRNGYRSITVSMNLSPRFLLQKDAVEQLLDVMSETGVDPRQVQLEITERTALDDFDGTVATLMEIRSLGVRIAIDDFGTGYSSLSYLKRLPVDVVKLDRSFVESMDTDEFDLAIVSAVITMSSALGMKVTAEGVERAEQAERLFELGCDAAAGFYWSKAVPPTELGRILRRGFESPGGPENGAISRFAS